MGILDAVAVDWWHSVTVGVLALALSLEALAAFCRQNAIISGVRESVSSSNEHSLWPRWWERPWRARATPGYSRKRFSRLDSAAASLFRGISRLMIASLFLARIAAKQPPLPIVDLGL